MISTQDKMVNDVQPKTGQVASYMFIKVAISHKFVTRMSQFNRMRVVQPTWGTKLVQPHLYLYAPTQTKLIAYRYFPSNMTNVVL